MSILLRETLQVTAAAGISFVVLTLLALFLKAEAATWKRPEDPQP